MSYEFYTQIEFEWIVSSFLTEKSLESRINNNPWFELGFWTIGFVTEVLVTKVNHKKKVSE